MHIPRRLLCIRITSGVLLGRDFPLLFLLQLLRQLSVSRLLRSPLVRCRFRITSASRQNENFLILTMITRLPSCTIELLLEDHFRSGQPNPYSRCLLKLLLLLMLLLLLKPLLLPLLMLESGMGGSQI